MIDKEPDEEDVTEEVMPDEKPDTLRETIDKARGASEEETEAPSDSGVEEIEQAPKAAPPEHWSQLDKDKFNALPEDIKPLYLDKASSLEKGYNEKFETVASWQKEKTTLDEIFQPLANELALSGVDRMDAVRRFVGAHQLLSRDPEAGLRWLAEQYGAAHLLPGHLEDDDGGPLDPWAANQIQQLQQQVAHLSQGFNGFQGTVQQQQNAQLQSQIDQFAKATDEKGNLKHPYFSDVRPTMAQLFQAGAVSSLDEAYEKATRLNDDVFAQVSKAKSSTADKEKDAKRREEAEKAKRAAGGRTVSSGAKGGASKFDNLRDAVEAAVRGTAS